MAQDVHADTFDILRGHKTPALDKRMRLGSQGQVDRGPWACPV